MTKRHTIWSNSYYNLELPSTKIIQSST